MKRPQFSLVLVALIFSLVSCKQKEPDFETKYLTVTTEKTFQLYDAFNENDFVVKYKDSLLTREQYTIDATKFDTSKIGQTSIKVTLNIAEEVFVEVPISINFRKTCKLLSIGDTYSEDLIYYSNLIAAKSNEDFEYNIYSIQLEDATLELHNRYLFEDKKLYKLMEYDFDNMDWIYIENKSLKQALLFQNQWDLILLQENVTQAHHQVDYDILNNFCSAIENYLGQNNRKLPAIAWHQVWAYQDDITINNEYYERFNNSQEAMYEAIASASSELMTNSNSISFIVPSGTIIQNARKSSIVTDNDFTRDGRHLDLQIGRYAVSLGLLTKISGYEPSHFAYVGEEGSPIITAAEKEVLDVIIKNSISNPFVIT
ncbi:MAG: hypothetical protein BWX74_00302 [Tenericutes bacterium ADurb.Bin087]|nr:MAG: hypothetical protein BWX74_00302 [Tenericutes bacterium ADurb.Bin087]